MASREWPLEPLPATFHHRWDAIPTAEDGRDILAFPAKKEWRLPTAENWGPYGYERADADSLQALSKLRLYLCMCVAVMRLFVSKFILVVRMGGWMVMIGLMDGWVDDQPR